VGKEFCITPRDKTCQPVIVSTSDGHSHEGIVTEVAGAVLFIETRKMVSVGEDVTIDGIAREGRDKQSVEGTVVWQCVREDEFGNQSGFAVCLKTTGNRDLNKD